MPEKAKHKTESARQGYPAATNDKDVLKADRDLLISLYNDEVKRADPDSIKKLEVGKLCDALRAPVKQQVIDMCVKTTGGIYKLFEEHGKWKNKPPAPKNVKADEKEVKLGDMSFMMGPLKKVPRIMQKAVNYAICDEEDVADPRLEKVVDILRGTLIFENEEFLLFNPDNGTANIGSRLIDAIHAEFGSGVIQVKNRFMLKRQAKLKHNTDKNFVAALNKSENHQLSLIDVNGDEVEDVDIVNTIATMVSLELVGRDTFYRDLQLLIKLPTASYSDDGVVSPLSHTYFELQITTRTLVDAKSGSPTQDTKVPNGHKRYEQLRRVMEYCEYVYWTYKKKEEAKKKGADFKYKMSEALLTEFFSTPLHADFEAFEDSLDKMWTLYQEHSPRGDKMKGIRNAIDDSEWYKKSKNK
jgi:hypothetical protein